MNAVVLLAPLVAFALIVLFGFVGCTLDKEGKGGPPPDGGNGGNGGNGEGGGPTNYSEAVISSGPIAYWRLSDDQASPSANDEIGPQPGGSHPGSYQGTVTHGGSPPGLNDSEPTKTPALFDGGGSVEVAHSDQAFETPQFTVELLVHLDSVVAPRGVLVSNMSAGGGWELVVVPPPAGAQAGTDGAFEAVVSDGTDRFSMGAEFDLTQLGTAWQVAMTFDGTTLSVYIDGLIAIESGVTVPYAPNTTDPLEIGTDFQGAIQEVAVYDYALDDELGWHLALKGPGQNP